MQQSDVYYQLVSQHVSGIIMPIFRRTKTVCYSMWCTALVLLDGVGSGCGALRCRLREHSSKRSSRDSESPYAKNAFFFPPSLVSNVNDSSKSAFARSN